MPPNDNFISRTIQSGVAAAGNFAGGVVDSAGRSVQGAGQGVGSSITNATHSLGDGTRNYGNGIKDATKADGPRSQTKENPLGLSKNQVARKSVVVGAKKDYTGVSSSGGKQTAGNPLGLS